MHKFEKLEVWQLAVEYADLCYAIAEKLPKSEEYNLASQLRRAAISIALNIAEGSTSQTDPEQARFLAMAIRSLVETVACQHLIHRRNYLADTTLYCARRIRLARGWLPSYKLCGIKSSKGPRCTRMDPSTSLIQEPHLM